MILVGDINRMLCGPWLLEFFDLVQSHVYENVIDCPTRVTFETITLIDFCVAIVLSDKMASGVLTVDLSDHLPLYYCVPCANISYKKRNIGNPNRDINDYSIERIVSLVPTLNWNDIYNEQDTSESYDKLLENVK